MKAPILLKTILDICFFILLVSLLFSTGFSLFYIFSGKELTFIHIKQSPLGAITIPKLILLLGAIIQSALFLYSIYVLRKVVRSFFRKKLFTSVQISGLYLTGNLIVFASILDVIIGFFANIILESKLKIGFEIESSFSSFWFQLALGLFLILLSKAFDSAKKLKEENDLTV